MKHQLKQLLYKLYIKVEMEDIIMLFKKEHILLQKAVRDLRLSDRKTVWEKCQSYAFILYELWKR